MEETSKNYDISFFKPTTRLATINRNLALILVSIWAVAIFGFQILLKILEKPTPEQTYISYESVWKKILGSSAQPDDELVFINSSLSVLGKLAINPKDKAVLDNVVSYYLVKRIPDSLKTVFVNNLVAFSKLLEENVSLSDSKYLEMKSLISKEGAGYLGIKDYSIEAKLLPFVLNADLSETFTDENKDRVPGVMSKYLIHNQSILTDFRLFGFPFHYFYTAVFLLILFVGLCWLYCYRTDKVMKDLGIEESTD